MARNLIAGTALALALAGAAQAQDSINITTYGGAFGEAVNQAFARPFTEATGIQANMVDNSDPPAKLKAEVEAGNVTSDVYDVEQSDVIRLCDEGLIEPIDPATLPAAADGTTAADDYLPQALHDCATAIMVWSTVIAYDTEAFPNGAPATVADFFDTAQFPGKRGIIKRPKYALEFALLGDGVPPDQVYDVLSTPEGVDRAFAKLDTIKDQVVWWEAGAQAPQLLADREVSMTLAYNGRIFDAIVEEGKPFAFIWDGANLDMDYWVVPRGAPDVEKSMQFIAFASDPARQADLSKYIAYGPPRKSAAASVGTYKDGTTEMAPYLPTTPENAESALVNDAGFWADHGTELTERFNAWLAG
ncbi:MULTISPECIES: ABC transporter substrate-binding protein [unclassified Paracoccus (in: a-proteobacteria)]|uniref:ABC transporter substrate-binding protein n=1 Tax=unclassified Paracoccus (in: a-proteobacteria) TaxID=2688777 RepID=UPI001601BD72|nr:MULTISPECIES: ABC transporter substrate-binding protein [unclassified Paracoccus (in: a-proteobacteria)]MBB1492422.1 ABC transporter substrate-binding protein [Paracoccus sp. MC1854]MBB1498991.1 ABC transporter substrate-binding protein [Paracoccus sp. MC1862]QQO45075.1 ABC transporter substrate-binding protein [Paracoccus sp. MC1862]